jgi:hypothetical protein
MNESRIKELREMVADGWDISPDASRELLTEVERLRAALEEIQCGDGQCNSKYGPGCDCACKSFAGKALGGE